MRKDTHDSSSSSFRLSHVPTTFHARREPPLPNSAVLKKIVLTPFFADKARLLLCRFPPGSSTKVSPFSPTLCREIALTGHADEDASCIWHSLCVSLSSSHLSPSSSFADERREEEEVADSLLFVHREALCGWDGWVVHWGGGEETRAGLGGEKMLFFFRLHRGSSC